MAFTEQEAIDMRQAISDLENKERQAAQTQFDADLLIARNWFLTVKPARPTTRDLALANVRFIEGLQRTETDRFRLIVLRDENAKAVLEFRALK